jgi:hypothetical protein
MAAPVSLLNLNSSSIPNPALDFAYLLILGRAQTKFNNDKIHLDAVTAPQPQHCFLIKESLGIIARWLAVSPR